MTQLTANPVFQPPVSQPPSAQSRKAQLVRAMQMTRQKTLALLAEVPDELLNLRVHEFYSPIGWHFGHIGMTEEAWTRVHALGQAPRDTALSFLFANLPENSKDNRVHLPPRKAIVAYLDATRQAALAALEQADITSPAPLLSNAYAWDFADQHECQHQETIAELRQLLAMHTRRGADDLAPDQAELVLQPFPPVEMAEISGGTFRMGSDAACDYDNEKNAQDVTVAPFRLDKTPVTAGQWIAFMQDGGYTRPELWSRDGWMWRKSEDATMPEYWRGVDRGYGQYTARGLRPIDPHQPALSLSRHEADAYARWTGKRLPTEAEWEFAARYDPQSGTTRLYPWGNADPDSSRADFGQSRPDPSPLPVTNLSPQEGGVRASATGVQHLCGSVWEWTATPFLPYPGFRAFPYDGYSQDHMDGKHYVCKGGSWASASRVLRASFRNWYVPTYRQGFLGLRCAL